MAESVHEQIAAALYDQFAEIVGDGGVTYWHTWRVGRTTAFEESDFDDSVGQSAHMVLRPGEETFAEETSGGAGEIGITADAEFFVLLATPFNAATESPWEQEGGDSRWLVVNRLVRDFVKKLFSDVQLAGLAENVVKDSLVIDRNIQPKPGWAMAEARFVVQYSFQSGTP